MTDKTEIRNTLNDAVHLSKQALERYFDGGVYRQIVDKDGDFPALEQKMHETALAFVEACMALDRERHAAARRDALAPA